MAIRELTIEELTVEAMKLLTIGLEELYVVLGCQLMVSSRPGRVAGMMSYQTALKKMIETQDMDVRVPIATDLTDWGRGFNVMYEELKQDGIRFLDAVRNELRKGGLCNEEILAMADEITSSSMQIIILIVAAILRMPPQMESLSATVAVILCKSGLRDFCK